MDKNRTDKILCSHCKTGAESYRLDSRSPFCPFVCLHKGNACIMFKELSESKGKCAN